MCRGSVLPWCDADGGQLADALHAGWMLVRQLSLLLLLLSLLLLLLLWQLLL
jgi:hypothetical protein